VIGCSEALLSHVGESSSGALLSQLSGVGDKSVGAPLEMHSALTLFSPAMVQPGEPSY